MNTSSKTAMEKTIRKLKSAIRLLTATQGQDLPEYALLVAAVALLAISLMAPLAGTIEHAFTSPAKSHNAKPLRPIYRSTISPGPPASPSSNLGLDESRVTEPISKRNPQRGSMLGGSNNSKYQTKLRSKPEGGILSRPVTKAILPPSDDQDLAESREQQAYQQILQRAKEGAIQYHVPPSMTVGTGATVTVEIYGADASAELKKQFQATGSGTLKVITPMLAELSQPDNPDAFKIVPDPTQSGDQFLPDAGKADWAWTVTPLQRGTEKLRIVAYMVMNAKLPNGQPIMSEVQSYTVQVPVMVKPRLEAIGDFLEANWDKLLGYILPSGAVVLFLIWLFSRKKKPSP